MIKKILILVPALALAVVAGAGDWTQWRGSNRDLLIKDEAVAASWPIDGPKQLWQIDLEGDGYAAPIVVAGKIYITGCVGDKKERKGMIYSLNARDGSIIWEREYGPEWGQSYERARTTPTYLDGKLYIISGLGGVVCLDAAKGSILWSVDSHKEFGGKNITWGIAENPLIYDGKLICQPGGDGAAVVALDIKTGKTIWKSTELSEKSAYCSPDLLTINGRKQLVTMLEDHVVGLEPATGKVLWKHAHRNKHAVHPNTPVSAGKDRVFVSSGYKYGAEVLEINGGEVKQLWQDKSVDNHFQGVAFYKGRIFTSGGNKFWCLDPASGKAVYTVNEARKTSFCILKDDMMITYDEHGGQVLLLKADENKYEIKGSFKITYGNDAHWSSPVVSGGVMYLRRGKGLAAFAVGG
ncbi:MAG: PQQ-binding-like beta-propeller repeat protein [Kiritimatiellae bacterium]|nr:PQQ-binding-like beta-propeller repeat protein [Kiritimatiellia bacterium]